MQPLTFFLPTRQAPIRRWVDPPTPTFRHDRCNPYYKWKGRLGRDDSHTCPPEPCSGTQLPGARESLIQVPWSRLGMHAVAYWSHLRRTRFVSLGSTENKSASRFAARFVTPSHPTPSPVRSGQHSLPISFRRARPAHNSPTYWSSSLGAVCVHPLHLSQLHNGEPRHVLLIQVTQRGGFRKDKFSCLPKATRCLKHSICLQKY